MRKHVVRLSLKKLYRFLAFKGADFSEHAVRLNLIEASSDDRIGEAVTELPHAGR